MNTFPLIRTRWSNEYIMAAMLGVLILYLLPAWVQRPGGILNFLAVVLVSLLIDAAINIVRYRKPVCGVSAAVTAGILYILTPGTALWLQIAGAAAALVLGKHIWGGTGKNPVNPAMTGLLLIGLLFELKAPEFSPQLLLLPALLLSIPFIRFRPYAAIGFMAGMAAALVFMQKFAFDSYLGYGAIFWGCLVLTDPVTVTPNRTVGAAVGALTGAAAMVLTGSTVVLAACVLLLNVISFITDTYLELPQGKIPAGKAIKKLIPGDSDVLYFDLSLSSEGTELEDPRDFNIQAILDRIEKNEVVGLGGAAFPAIRKIRAVMESPEEKKYLVVNGVECDPGLIHDHWLINRHMKEICAGIKLLRKCVDFEIAALAVKENTEIKACEVNVVRVPDYYPAGAERNLIGHVLGKELPIDDIPAKKGILVLNVQTVFAIYEAVYRDKKADTKLITVADLKSGADYVVKAKLGTGIRDMIQMLPVASGNVFAGGGAMQCRNTADDDVVDKNVNFIAVSAFPRYKESVLCSKCGICAGNCPMGIRVDRISRLMEQDRQEEAKKYQPERCIQCGNCSRVCLAGKNLAMRVKAAKAN